MYADRVDQYMIMPASQDADKVKDKLQQSNFLCVKDLKEETDRWPSINSVLDFCYFTVNEVIEYMTRLYKEQYKAYKEKED